MKPNKHWIMSVKAKKKLKWKFDWKFKYQMKENIQTIINIGAKNDNIVFLN